MKHAALLLMPTLLLAACGTAPLSEQPAGPVQTLGKGHGIPSVLASAIALDRAARTVTLPLFRGVGPDGRDVYYIIIDSSNFGDAVARGVNWAPKMTKALGTRAVMGASVVDASPRARRANRGQPLLRFAGGVDFRPVRTVVPGPEGFPLDPATTAGSVGDANYSPLVTAGDGIVHNAAVVANASGLHDDVLAIDLARLTVTLRLVAGFYEGADVLYINTEASNEDIAALESATYAPNLDAAPAAGDRDPRTSAREAIITVVNGPAGVDNPQRQGLRSAVAGEGDPLNIIREEPECGDPRNCSALLYSPLWDVTPVAWTPEAVAAGRQVLLKSHVDVIRRFQGGDLVSAAPGGPVNTRLGNLRAAGVIVNCPPIFVAVNAGPDDGE